MGELKLHGKLVNMWEAIVKLVGGAATAGISYLAGRQAQKNEQLEVNETIRRKQENVFKGPRLGKRDIVKRLHNNKF